MTDECLLVAELPLSISSAYAAKALGCKTVGDVRAKGKRAFLRLPNVGQKVIRDITNVIGEWPDGPPIASPPAFIPPQFDLSTISTDCLLAELKRRIP